ncbi:MAG: hypothetical protein WBJ36_07905 [Tenuifilum sp.]|uniref:hypothetical protein n=1 Tax=Tenuifilum sp. TaxID=2760880 RepID=UPI003CA11F60
MELPRDTIRHAGCVAQVVSLTKPTATFHPRPIAGSGFYATACFFRSIPPLWKMVGVRLYPTSNEQRATYTNDFICHPEHSVGSLIDPMGCFACAQHDNSFTNNEQRFPHRRGVIFVKH